MRKFNDKIIIITGASEGIGRALAKELSPKGTKLILAARNRERLESLMEECAELGAEALVSITDVSDQSACQALVETAVEAFGGVDVLVNNAGQTMWTTLEDMEDPSIIERIIRSNYLSAAWLAYYALPHLKASKGQIVNVASVAGIFGAPTRTAYAGSKHAMFGFFESLRVESIGSGLSVVMVAPDFVRSHIHDRALTKTGKELGVSPLADKKIMSAEQCARIIVKGMEKDKRLVLTSFRSRLARWVKMFLPGLVDRMALRSITEAGGDKV